MERANRIEAYYNAFREMSKIVHASIKVEEVLELADLDMEFADLKVSQFREMVVVKRHAGRRHRRRRFQIQFMQRGGL